MTRSIFTLAALALCATGAQAGDFYGATRFGQPLAAPVCAPPVAFEVREFREVRQVPTYSFQATRFSGGYGASFSAGVQFNRRTFVGVDSYGPSVSVKRGLFGRTVVRFRR